MHSFKGPTQDFILSELDRWKGDLRTQLVWIGAQKEPGLTNRIWKWVNGKDFTICFPTNGETRENCHNLYWLKIGIYETIRQCYFVTLMYKLWLCFYSIKLLPIKLHRLHIKIIISVCAWFSAVILEKKKKHVVDKQLESLKETIWIC